MRERRSAIIPALDGVRGIAIVLVVWSHTGLRLDAYGIRLPLLPRLLTAFSYSGVDLFFVLSGFLLFLPYAPALLDGTPLPSVRRFYLRRARRILPAYFTVLAVILALLALAGWPSVAPGCRPTVGTVLSGVTLLYDLVPHGYCVYFAMDGPLWSLTVEWQFYLLLPALTFGLWWLRARRGLGHAVWYGLAAVMLCSFAVGIAAARLHYALAPGELGLPWPWQVPYALLFGTNGKFLGSFALGMVVALLYTLYTRSRAAGWAAPGGRWLLAGAGLAATGVLAVALVWAAVAGKLGGGMTPSSIVFPHDPAQWAWAVWGDWLICAGYATLILVVLFVPTLARVLSLPPLRFLGHISYSVYLWHILIFASLPSVVMWPLVSRPVSGWLTLLCEWLLAFGWGTASYYIVERPFLRIRADGAADESARTELVSRSMAERVRAGPFTTP